ncbi:hypothetical protein ADK57_39270 [Streptomyces sp. MMG1533]|uniref:hypothetical protein n=1 Tax=Streptomyces sp. MMG1533 TaxID=1415546 RepID=UPI0006AF7CE1|nr:hypothetical protein [Streptomyces sp. MMG1533]KOU57382.1 hypothetical protein ADK57_39270 [Streptomyces sp. MMG1533]
MEQEDASLREDCMKALRGIDLPRPFTVEAFCSQLAQQRNRPLHLRPGPTRSAFAGICGVWIATAGEDYIFYEAQTSRLHQEHIILHEVGHMLLEHRIHDEDARHEGMGSVEALLPDLRPRSIRRFFGRTDYTTWQEREAEMLASLIGVQARRLRTRKSSEALVKLGTAFGLGLPDVD